MIGSTHRLAVMFALLCCAPVLISNSGVRAGVITNHATVTAEESFYANGYRVGYFRSPVGGVYGANSAEFDYSQSQQLKGYPYSLVGHIRAGSGSSGPPSPSAILRNSSAAVGPGSTDFAAASSLQFGDWVDGLTISGLDRVYTAKVTFYVDATIQWPGTDTGLEALSLSLIPGANPCLGGRQVYFVADGHGYPNWQNANCTYDRTTGQVHGTLVTDQFTIGPNTYFYGDTGWSAPGSIWFDLRLETQVGVSTGTAAVDAWDTAGIQSVLFQDSHGNWVTPESLGLGVAFDSGMHSPNASSVPEPSTLVMFTGLGTMGLIGAWRRRRRAA